MMVVVMIMRRLLLDLDEVYELWIAFAAFGLFVVGVVAYLAGWF